MTSRLPAVDRSPPRARRRARRIVLDVPRYSQMVHAGRVPAVRRRRRGLVLADLDVDGARLLRRAAAAARRTPGWASRYVDRAVDHAARMTFDHGYDGTGNWPFNTAYAAALGPGTRS